MVSYVLASVFMIASCSYAQVAHAPLRRDIAFVIDLDDIISYKKPWGSADFLSLLPRVVWSNPAAVAFVFPKNRAVFAQESKNIRKVVNGAANVIHAQAEMLKRLGYGDFSVYEDHVLERGVKPAPIVRMIETIKDLKKQGYLVLGATNQDYKQYDVYYNKLKSHYNIDLKDVFHGILVTRIDTAIPPLPDSDLFYARDPHDPFVYVAVKDGAWKPHKIYYDAAKAIIALLAPGVRTLIFTDDKKENVDGAIADGFIGVQFALPTPTARQATKDELNHTITVWRNTIARYGVTFNHSF